MYTMNCRHVHSQADPTSEKPGMALATAVLVAAQLAMQKRNERLNNFKIFIVTRISTQLMQILLHCNL
jgi:hypothetical protein